MKENYSPIPTPEKLGRSLCFRLRFKEFHSVLTILLALVQTFSDSCTAIIRLAATDNTLLYKNWQWLFTSTCKQDWCVLHLISLVMRLSLPSRLT